MTMTMSPLMSEQHQQPPQGGKPREHSGLLAMPTREIKLSPEFVDALKQVAPKTRRRVLRYVLALAVLVAGVSLAVVPEARHRIASAWHRMWHGEPPAAASVAPPVSAPLEPTVSADTALPSAAASASAIVIPPVVISSAAPDTSSSSSSKPSKPPKRRHGQSQR
jgi:hypothetical protein